MLADASPDVATFGPWMLNFIYILGVVLAACHIYLAWRKYRPAPEAEFVTRGEMHREIRRVEQELHVMQKEQQHVLRRLVWMSGLLVQLCHKQDIPVPPPPLGNAGDDAS